MTDRQFSLFVNTDTDDEAGFSDLESGFERPAIIAGPVLDENGKSWYDRHKIAPAPVDPAPAAEVITTTVETYNADDLRRYRRRLAEIERRVTCFDAEQRTAYAETYDRLTAERPTLANLAAEQRTLTAAWWDAQHAGDHLAAHLIGARELAADAYAQEREIEWRGLDTPPAPAAVDTGAMHGPALDVAVEVPYFSDQPCACGRNLETTVVMTGGALCRYCQSRKAGGLTYGADYPHAQHLADCAAYRQSREQPTYAASIDAAAHALGRELTTREACALFA